MCFSSNNKRALEPPYIGAVCRSASYGSATAFPPLCDNFGFDKSLDNYTGVRSVSLGLKLQV